MKFTKLTCAIAVPETRPKKAMAHVNFVNFIIFGFPYIFRVFTNVDSYTVPESQCILKQNSVSDPYSTITRAWKQPTRYSKLQQKKITFIAKRNMSPLYYVECCNIWRPGLRSESRQLLLTDRGHACQQTTIGGI